MLNSVKVIQDLQFVEFLDQHNLRPLLLLTLLLYYGRGTSIFVTYPQKVGVFVILFALPDHIFCRLFLRRQISFLFCGIKLTTQIFFNHQFNVTLNSSLLDTFSKNFLQEHLIIHITFMFFELQGKVWAFWLSFRRIPITVRKVLILTIQQYLELTFQIFVSRLKSKSIYISRIKIIKVVTYCDILVSIEVKD